MPELKPGSLARSLAGHDKDRYFIILREDGEYVALADGVSKTVEKPKRKKKKHIQPVNRQMIDSFPVTDERIRKVIKSYKRSQSSNEEVREHVESRCN